MTPGARHGPDDPAAGTSGILDYYRRIAPLMDREARDPGERAFWEQEFARTVRGGRAVDVGCGTGVLTRLLARRTARAVGVDLSPDMLRVARRRTRDDPGVLLVRGNVRRLPLAGRWELAVAAGGVFGHLLEDEHRNRALAEIARILRPGGRLLMEGLWFAGPEFRIACREGLVRERPLEGAPSPVVREEWRCDAGSRICRARFRYGPPGGPAHTSAAFTARVWEEDEIGTRLDAAGFAVVAAWGDFRRGPWDPDSSRRLLIRARKR